MCLNRVLKGRNIGDYYYFCVANREVKLKIMDNFATAQGAETFPHIEHIREFHTTTTTHSADHFCIGYIFRGRCRIDSATASNEISERTAYIIGRGDHTLEYTPGELGIFEQIIIHLRNDATESTSEALALPDKELLRFENAVIMGLAANLSVEELAERCCISLSTFKRRFRLRYCQPPHRWLTEQRLQLTRAAILSTSLSLSDIVEASGFINSSHFISLFRRHFGITPARLRRMHRRGKRMDKKDSSDQL